jgi:hypothetical protein
VNEISPEAVLVATTSDHIFAGKCPLPAASAAPARRPVADVPAFAVDSAKYLLPSSQEKLTTFIFAMPACDVIPKGA